MLKSNYKFELEDVRIESWEPYYFQNRSSSTKSYIRAGGKGLLCWKEGYEKFEEKFEATDSEVLQKIDDSWQGFKFKVYGNLSLKNGFGRAAGKTYNIHNILRVEVGKALEGLL